MPGNDEDHPSPATVSTPAEAFALVGHELRAEIIWVLGDPERDEMELSFGDVRRRLDVDVDPSQLHYHLQQLVGHFVVKTDTGYRLNAAGIRLCLTLRTGTFDSREEQLAIDTDVACHFCQAPVEVHYNQLGVVTIKCPDCEHRYGNEFLETPFEAFKPGAAASVFPHFRNYIICKTLFLARGVCPSCANQLAPTLHSGEDHPYKVCIHQTCDLCGLRWDLSAGRALLADPDLIAFSYDHGVDILSTPFWELKFAATDDNVTIRSTDPWEVALEVTFDGDTLELVVDGDLNVLERNRLDSSRDVNPSLVHGILSDVQTMVNRDSGEGVVLPDTADCVESLRRHRWQDDVTCPHCDSRNQIKKGTTDKGAQRYRCQDCDRSFNDLTGTIFAERGLSLPEMFHIIRQSDETETAQIARELDRSYKSVLEFVHTVQDTTTEHLGSDR